MNGAQSLIQALNSTGVTVCFANPGTSEMHLVQALDATPEQRAVLVLFEGVASGAADGYARIAGKPAATLLHLGPGLGNALANLHNARRAHMPVINIVGDHATDHLQYDAPLTSDLDAFARAAGSFVRHTTSADGTARDVTDAVEAALAGNGQPVTLICHADHMWSEAAPETVPPIVPAAPEPIDEDAFARAVAALTSARKCMLLVGGAGVRDAGQEQAGRIAAKTGCRLVAETFPARMSRGSGRVQMERLPYFPEMMQDFVKGIEALIVIGVKPPTSFFAYQGKPSLIVPENGEVILIGDDGADTMDALSRLATAVEASGTEPTRRGRSGMPIAPGPLNLMGIGATLGAHLPATAIVVDEGCTSGFLPYALTETAEPHDWLTLTGGSIGWGISASVGAAIAAPERKVVTLHGDGGAMYTVQALWTMAREQLDVTTVIFSNRAYCILGAELARTGLASNTGTKGKQLLSLDNPPIDWVKLAEGMGVTAFRPETNADFESVFKTCMATPGPKLIEARIPAVG